MANTYDVGDLVQLSVTFKNSAGTNTDPTTVTFKLQTPDAATTTYVYGTDSQLVKSATGVYHVNWSCTQVGLHLVSWVGTGTIETAEEGYFHVSGRFM